MAYPIQCRQQGFCQMARAGGIALQQMKRHSLRGLRTHARQTTQSTHQLS
jgi:hypothetical protein